MTVKNSRRLIVMAGGTGGHVFPGLEVAHNLMIQGWKVSWIGTKNHIEAKLIPKHGININYINIKGICGNGFKRKLFAPLQIIYAFLQAQQIIRMWRPNVALGMGGYVSGPSCLAAWSCGVPIILHEQNSIPGLTNRTLAKIAHKVLQAFPAAFHDAEVVGNPIRDSILKLPEPAIRFHNRTGPIRVLVIGGSQGARILNQIMPEVAATLPGFLTLKHQVGKGALEEVSRAYTTTNKTQYMVVEFIDDIATDYAWADVVVCRAGALTVSEIAAAGLPALFVPFMHKDRQQYWNAWPLEHFGAAKIIEQPNFNVKQVSNVLASWDRTTLLTMAERAKMLSISDATERIAQEVKKVAQNCV